MRFDFREYVQAFEARYAHLGTLRTVTYLDEPGGPFPLLSLTVPGERWLVITSGFHGEEPAPPLTLLERTAEVVDYARSRGVGLHLYPCINPSGFEDGSRYNRSGEKPNNDFIRYTLDDGRVVGEVDLEATIVRWDLHVGGPKETAAMREELHRHPVPVAALDLHQDRYLEGAYTYAYIFGDRERFMPLVEESARHAALAKDYRADEKHITDQAGLVEHHDGSVTDYFHRRGALAACLETTTGTPLEKCHEINMAWIRGFIDFAAAG